MEKFLLTLTKGDDKAVLSVHDTKQEAINAGEKFLKETQKVNGFLAVIYAEIDSCKNIVGGKYKLYHGWQ